MERVLTMTRGNHRQPRSSVRIIGGRYRGRRLPVATERVRPTGDRLRETLFNWLQPVLPGARCLDMFAGTGVLGIEALSRGARAVTLVERDRGTAARLRQSLEQLGITNADLVVADAVKLDLAALGRFDIVFMDPPFAGVDHAALCKLLHASGCLVPGALVYLELPRTQALPRPCEDWVLHRQAAAGQVQVALYTTGVSRGGGHAALEEDTDA